MISGNDEPIDNEESSRLYQKGRTALLNGQFRLAVQLFEASHRVLPHPVTILELLKATALAGDYERARVICQEEFSSSSKWRVLCEAIHLITMRENVLLSGGADRRSQTLACAQQLLADQPVAENCLRRLENLGIAKGGRLGDHWKERLVAYVIGPLD